jgi:hypothetical protein
VHVPYQYLWVLFQSFIEVKRRPLAKIKSGACYEISCSKLLITSYEIINHSPINFFLALNGCIFSGRARYRYPDSAAYDEQPEPHLSVICPSFIGAERLFDSYYNKFRFYLLVSLSTLINYAPRNHSLSLIVCNLSCRTRYRYQDSADIEEEPGTILSVLFPELLLQDRYWKPAHPIGMKKRTTFRIVSALGFLISIHGTSLFFTVSDERPILNHNILLQTRLIIRTLCSATLSGEYDLNSTLTTPCSDISRLIYNRDFINCLKPTRWKNLTKVDFQGKAAFGSLRLIKIFSGNVKFYSTLTKGNNHHKGNFSRNTNNKILGGVLRIESEEILMADIINII